MVKWVPKPDDFVQVFHEQNPWLRYGSVPLSLAPEKERPFAQLLWKRLLKTIRVGSNWFSDRVG